MYRVYEMRLRQGLASAKSELPRHIAVLCDGNRRWARDAGHDDVSYGYRMGAHKIAEMLRWCQETGIEMATVYLLSTENLQRDPGELASLIQHKGSSVNAQRQKEAHAHSIVVSPNNKYAFAADLGSDQIISYKLDPAAAKLTIVLTAFTSHRPHSAMPAGMAPATSSAPTGTCVRGDRRLRR